METIRTLGVSGDSWLQERVFLTPSQMIMRLSNRFVTESGEEIVLEEDGWREAFVVGEQIFCTRRTLLSLSTSAYRPLND